MAADRASQLAIAFHYDRIGNASQQIKGRRIRSPGADGFGPVCYHLFIRAGTDAPDRCFLLTGTSEKKGLDEASNEEACEHPGFP